jgi:hypothetical protein
VEWTAIKAEIFMNLRYSKDGMGTMHIKGPLPRFIIADLSPPVHDTSSLLHSVTAAEDHKEYSTTQLL